MGEGEFLDEIEMDLGMRIGKGGFWLGDCGGGGGRGRMGNGRADGLR